MTFFFYIVHALTEDIEIRRLMPNGDLSKWTSSIDLFYISQTACFQEWSPYGNYCTTVCNTGEIRADQRYSCSCTASNATLTYHNNQWRCRENAEVRKQLGECLFFLFRALKI